MVLVLLRTMCAAQSPVAPVYMTADAPAGREAGCETDSSKGGAAECYARAGGPAAVTVLNNIL